MEKDSSWREVLVSGQDPEIGWILNSGSQKYYPPLGEIQFASRDLIYYQIECKSKRQIYTESYSNTSRSSNYPWFEDYKKSQAKDIIFVRTTKVKEKKAHNDLEFGPSQSVVMSNCYKPSGKVSESREVVTSLCYKASVDILLHFDRRVTDGMAKQLYIYLSNVLNGSKVQFLPPFIDRFVKVVNVYCKGNQRKYDNKSLFGLKESCRILQEHECKVLTSVKVMNHMCTKTSDKAFILNKNKIQTSSFSRMSLPVINKCKSKCKLISDKGKLSEKEILHVRNTNLSDCESMSDAFKLRSLGRGKLLSGLNNKYITSTKNIEHTSKMENEKPEQTSKKENTKIEDKNVHGLKKKKNSQTKCLIPSTKYKKPKKRAIGCQITTSESDENTQSQDQMINNYNKRSINKDRKNKISMDKSEKFSTEDNVSTSSSKGRRCAVSERIVESVANLNAGKLNNDTISFDYSLALSCVNPDVEVKKSLNFNGFTGFHNRAYVKAISEDVMKKLEEKIYDFTTGNSMPNSKTIGEDIWELALVAKYQLNCIQYSPSTVEDILIQVVHKVCKKYSIDPFYCLKKLSFCSTRPLRNAIEGILTGLNEIYIHAKQITDKEKKSSDRLSLRERRDINNNKLEEITCFITLLCSWCNKMHKLERMSSTRDIDAPSNQELKLSCTDNVLMLCCTECDCEAWKHRNLNEHSDDFSFRVSPNKILQYTKKKLENLLLKHNLFGMKLDLLQTLLIFLEDNEDTSYIEFINDLINFVE